MNRKLVIVLGVIVLHIAVLWVLQTGLLGRTTEQIVTVEILSEIILPPIPRVAPQPTAPPLPHVPPRAAAPAPIKRPIAAVAAPLQAPAPQALTDAIHSPPLDVAPRVTSPGPAASPAASPIAAAPSAASTVELPSSNADYLHNPKPAYPKLSQQRDEQGTVVVHVQIGANGHALQAEIKQSSGFHRLDQAALDAALRWRYLPGKRAGVPETMWVDVPFSFIFE